MKHPNMKCTQRQMRMLSQVICLAAALMLLVLSAQAQTDTILWQAQTDTVLPPIGGGGGGYFDARCPEGQNLAGVELRTGDDVDAIRPLCVTAYGPADVGPPVPGAAWFGGNGGGRMVQLLCPKEDPIVRRMTVEAEGVGTVVVHEINLFCGAEWKGPETSVAAGRSFLGLGILGGNYEPSPGARFDDQRCPDGLVAVGINGRSGKWLDAVGLICGAPRLTTKAQPGVGSIGRVKTGVGSFGRVKIPAQKSSVIYGIGSDGVLKWSRYDGAATGAGLDPGAWIGPKDVGTGWDEYTRVFPGGGDIIYGIKADGTLEWRKHRGFGSGDDVWAPPKNVGHGWGGFKHVFSGGEGIIYAISEDGRLWWYHHIAYRTGGALEEPGAWEGRTVVGRGWNGFSQVFSTGGGVIYAISEDGRLWWYLHKAYKTGGLLETPGAWEGRTVVGRGWNGFKHVFSAGDGIIYAISEDGRLWWYRHIAYRTGGLLETPGAWEGRTVIGRGWGDFSEVFALLPFDDTGGQTSGSTPTGRSGDSTVLVGRHGGVNRDAQPSNQVLCRGSSAKLRVAGSNTELKDFYDFRTLSSRIDSTGAAMLTVQLGGNAALVAAGSDGAGLGEGQCAWLDRPLGGNGGAGIRFEVPANAQLNQVRHGTPVDTSPTAAERFPDASNIPTYLTSDRHYWIFTAYETGPGYLQATASRHWKRTPGLGDAAIQPVDPRGVRIRDRVSSPTRP